MQFVIEDKKNITFFQNFLKSCQCNKTELSLLVSKKGWIVLQNGDQLENFENKNLVFFQHFQDNFFTSLSQNQEFQNKTLALEYDFQILLKSLKCVKYSTKKIVFKFSNQDVNDPNFYQMGIHVLTDEGQLQFQKGFYNNQELAMKFNTYKQALLEFDDDKTLYLSVNGKYLKQLKDMRNYPTEWKIQEQNLIIKSPNQPEMSKLHVDKSLFEIYNYEAFQNCFKGSLLIPPNLVDPHLFLQQKSRASSMKIYLQTIGFGSNKNVVFYIKSTTEFYQFFHAFVCVEQVLEEDQYIDVSKGSISQTIDQNIMQIEQPQKQIHQKRQTGAQFNLTNQPSLDKSQSQNSDINVFDKQFQESNNQNNDDQSQVQQNFMKPIKILQQSHKIKKQSLLQNNNSLKNLGFQTPKTKLNKIQINIQQQKDNEENNTNFENSNVINSYNSSQQNVFSQMYSGQQQQQCINKTSLQQQFMQNKQIPIQNQQMQPMQLVMDPNSNMIYMTPFQNQLQQYQQINQLQQQQKSYLLPNQGQKPNLLEYLNKQKQKQKQQNQQDLSIFQIASQKNWVKNNYQNNQFLNQNKNLVKQN